MADTTQDLPVAAADRGADLTPDFSLDELVNVVLSDIGRFARPLRQAGDVDMGQIQAAFRVSPKQALTIAEKAVTTGRYQTLVVWDRDAKKTVKVLRQTGGRE